MTPIPDLDALERLVERLRRKRQVYNGLGTFRDEIVNPGGPEAAAAIESLLTQLRAVRSALEPFARMADLIEPLGMDDAEWCGEEESVTLQVGDYRKARAALTGPADGEG